MNITISYGANNSLQKTVSEGTTVGQVVRDANIRAALGYGDNIQVVMDGVVANDATTLRAGDELVVENKACQKAG